VRDYSSERFLRVLLQREVDLLVDQLPLPLAQLVLLQSSHFQTLDLATKALSAFASERDLRSASLSPGLMALSCHSHPPTRRAALSAISRVARLGLAEYQDPYTERKDALHYLLQLSLSPRPDNLYYSENSTDDSDVWTAIATCIPKIDRQVLLQLDMGKSLAAHLPAKFQGKTLYCPDVMRIVLVHLGDSGPHWTSVLKAFAGLVASCGTEIWSSGDLTLCGVLMHAILDNAVIEARWTAGRPVFPWAIPFLQTLLPQPAFLESNALALLDVFFSRFQAPRFDLPAQVRSAQLGIEVLQLVHASNLPCDVVCRIVEPSAQFLVDLAFSAPFAHFAPKATDSPVEAERKMQEHDAWRPVSEAARTVLEDIATRDADHLESTLMGMADQLASANEQTKLSPLQLTSLLPLSFEAIKRAKSRQSADAILRAVQPCLHLEELDKRAWLGRKEAQVLKPLFQQIDKLMKSHILPVSELLQALADTPSHLNKLQLLGTRGTIEALMAALLSPWPDIHNAALAFVEEVYDLSSRPEAFRSLLENFPRQSLDGLCAGMERFCRSVKSLPDACRAAMRIARCMTNVMESLCDNMDGLLRTGDWSQKHNLAAPLNSLWSLLCDSSASIYSKTIAWAPYHENAMMVDWMRDAVLFGDGLVAQAGTFEAVLKSKGKLVAALNPPVISLLSWLRLNDTDLLRTVGDLALKMLDRFAKSKVPLDDAIIARIQKYALRQRTTLMDPSEILKLVFAIRRHPLYSDTMADVIPQNLRASSPAKATARPADVRQPAASTSTQKAAAPKLSADKPKAQPAQPKEVQSSLRLVPDPARPKPKEKPKFKETPMRNAPKINFSHAALRKAQEGTSSDDDESEDDKPKGLASLATKTPKINSEGMMKRQTKKLDVEMDRMPSRRGPSPAFQGPTDAQHAALVRIAPDLTPLHRVILQWVR
jgi:senataxin